MTHPFTERRVEMLNLSCVLAVGSVAVLFITVAALLIPRTRTVSRRLAISSAFVFLASAAAFSHYSDLEAHARGFKTFSDMLAASRADVSLARS